MIQTETANVQTHSHVSNTRARRHVDSLPSTLSKPWARLRHAAAVAWLNFLFFSVRRWPQFSRKTKSFFLFFAWYCSPWLRDGTMKNARWLLGASATATQRRRLAKAVISHFFDFVCDVGWSSQATPQQLAEQVEQTIGWDRYQAVRQQSKGAILVTAHMGSFEVAVAALSQYERRIHVVYHRDKRGRFEHLRSLQRQRLGIMEAPVEEGWPMWWRLRNALTANEVVLVQGDRVMPGQRGIPMPFMGGHIMIPPGPVKLAMASGAPMIPTFAVRTKGGRIRVVLERPIRVPRDGQPVGPHHPAMRDLTNVVERYVRTYPDQWLMLQGVWCEDKEQTMIGKDPQT